MQKQTKLVRTWNSTTSEQGRDWEYFEHSPLHSSGIMPFRKAVFEHGKCEKANASNATTHGCSMLQIKLQGAHDVSNDMLAWTRTSFISIALFSARAHRVERSLRYLISHPARVQSMLSDVFTGKNHALYL